MSHSVLADGIRSVIGGGTPSRSVGSYWTGDIPWASVKDLSDNRLTLYDTEEHITPAALRASASNLVPPGTVIVCTRMAVGRAAMTMVPTAINQDLKALFTNERLRPRYLLHLLQILKPKLEAKAIGSTVKGIGVRDLLAVPVLLPDTTGQDRIIEVLDRADKAIQYSASIIARMRLIKVGLIHDLLTRGLNERGQMRDPVAHPEEFKDSKIGRIPNNWEISTLQNLSVDGIRNGLFKRPEAVGRGCRLVNVMDLYQDFGVNLNHVERVAASKQEQEQFAVREGDCFFTRSSLVLDGIAHCNTVRHVEEPTVFECHIIRVRPNERHIRPEFLTYWCRSPDSRRFLMARAKHTTMTTISQPDIALLPVPMPSLSEQFKIIDVLDQYSEHIQAEISLHNKLVLQKQGLMAELLTGRVSAHA